MIKPRNSNKNRYETISQDIPRKKVYDKIRKKS